MKYLKYNRILPVRNIFAAVCFSMAVFFIQQPSNTESHQSASKPPSASKAAEVCGTWITLNGMAEGNLLLESLSRPPDGTFIQDSDHFRVHYEESQLQNYALDILTAAEKAYLVLIDTLGYFIPPSDHPNGGDARTDIYVTPAAGFPYLGMTTPELLKATPFPNAWTSYIQLTDTLGTDLLLTTTTHEYFHVIQFGYDEDEDVSFLEMTAVWSEDRVYDDINAYLRYLPSFFSQPEKALFSHAYSNVVWAVYLSENFGDDVIKNIFDVCGADPGNNVRAATDSVLVPLGSDMVSEFAAFTIWNFFTGARDNGLCYEEGASFPLVTIEKKVDCLPLLDYSILREPATLGSNYIQFYGDHSTDSFRIDVVPEWWAFSVLTATWFTPGGMTTDRYDYQPFTLNPPPLMKPLWSEVDSLLVIYGIDKSAQPRNSMDISAYHTRTEPPSLPFVLILDRDGCRRPFDGINDDFSIRDGEDYPFADALDASSVRFVLSDSIPENLAYCDAIFIIGGYDVSGVVFQPTELETLMVFMDRGGDVYLESDRIGQWIDPVIGEPSAAEEAFWGYFGCGFQPGDTMTVGNVSDWHTLGSSVLGAFSFLYDMGSPADNFVGNLIPSPAETLAVDQSGLVRATLHMGPNQSFRIHSTVLLGASTDTGDGSARSDYLYCILDAFGSTVPALAVAFMSMTTHDGRVDFDGEIEGYGGEPLVLVRYDGKEGGGKVEIPLMVHGDGNRVRLSANDSPLRGRSYLYRLTAVIGGYQRTLWEGRVAVEASPLSLKVIYPNPSHGDFTLIVEAPEMETAMLRIFDAAGRLVYRDRRVLATGTNEVVFESGKVFGGPLASGVYFLRLDASNGTFQKKIVILR